MSYRDDVAALAARHAALAAEVTRIAAQRDQLAQLLADARRPVRTLPVVAASPCAGGRERCAVVGDGRVATCGGCHQPTYDISGLDRDAAEALIFAHEGRLASRYHRRADGRLLFADCWVGAAPRRRKRRILAAVALLAAATAAAVVAPSLPRAAVRERSALPALPDGAGKPRAPIPARPDRDELEAPRYVPMALPETATAPPAAEPREAERGYTCRLPRGDLDRSLLTALEHQR